MVWIASLSFSFIRVILLLVKSTLLFDISPSWNIPSSVTTCISTIYKMLFRKIQQFFSFNCPSWFMNCIWSKCPAWSAWALILNIIQNSFCFSPIPRFWVIFFLYLSINYMLCKFRRNYCTKNLFFLFLSKISKEIGIIFGSILWIWIQFLNQFEVSSELF